MRASATRSFLNAGSGGRDRGCSLEVLARSNFAEVRIDIDPRTAPDLVGSIADMSGLVDDQSFDAIWSSHCLEHLHDHEARTALREFRRVLRPDGFAIVTCPDLSRVVHALESEDIESVAYLAPAGPIRLLDILFGHSASIEAGYTSMAHNTAFTSTRLGRLATGAGFAEARILQGDNFDLWAALLMPNTNVPELERLFSGTIVGPLFRSHDEPTSIPKIEPSADRRIRILRP